MPDIWDYFDHFSATCFNTFDRCMEQGRRRYILGEIARPAGNLIWGKADHAGVAYDLTKRIDDPEVGAPLDEVLDAASDVFLEEVEEAGGAEEVDWGSEGLLAGSVNEYKLVATAQRERMLRLVSLYHAQVCPTLRPVGVETEFSLEVPFSKVPIIGYIDVTEGDALRERKTASRTPNKGTVPGRWLTQGRIYQLHDPKPVCFDVSVKTKDPRVVRDHFIEPPSERNDKITLRKMQVTIQRIKWCLDTFGPDNPWPDAIADEWACRYCGWGPYGKDVCFWHRGEKR